MNVSTRIQIDSDTWIVMREYTAQPKAIIQRLTSVDGMEWFQVFTWEPIKADRRLVSVHPGIEEADQSVPWPSNRAQPPTPGASPQAERDRFERHRRRSIARGERAVGNRVPVENVPADEAWG